MNINKLQPSFAGGELAAEMYARIDLNKYSIAFKEGKNFFIRKGGGIFNRFGTEYIGTVKNSSKKTYLKSFTYSSTDKILIEVGEEYFRYYKNDAIIESGGSPVETVTPYQEEDLEKLKTERIGNAMYIVNKEYAVRKLIRTSDTVWALSTVAFLPSISAPTGANAVATGSAPVTRTWNYVVTAIKDDDTNEESLVSNVASCTNNVELDYSKYNTISWNIVTGAKKYYIYQEVGGVYSWIGETTTLSFKDTGFTYYLDDNPPENINPFSSAGNYPSVVAMLNERIIYASTKNNPNAIYASRVGQYDNFSIGTSTQDNDALIFSLANDDNARKVNNILTLNALIVLTEGSIKKNDSYPLTNSNLSFFTESYDGSSDIDIAKVGNNVIYVQNGNKTVRNYIYSNDLNSFTGDDLTVFANHIFKDVTIKKIAFQRRPNNILWCVCSDGTLRTLTFVYEQQVLAWTRQDTNGLFEDVVVLGGDLIDEVYFIVKRGSNRIIEKYQQDYSETVDQEDVWHLDSAVRYEGAKTSTITGLGHLEGLEVTVLNNGNVEFGHIVSSGQITLNYPTTKCLVGLSYTSRLQGLDIALITTSSVQGKPKRANAVKLLLENTRGLKIGTNNSALVEIKQRKLEDWGEPIRPFNGWFKQALICNYQNETNIVIEQSYPLTAIINSIVYDITVGADR